MLVSVNYKLKKMKKNLLLVLSIISMGHMLKAQQFFPPNLLWQNCYGGSNNDKGNAIKFTPDGGFIIVGSTLSSDSDVTSNAGNYDMWVVKLNSLGVIQWQQTYGGSSSDIGNDVLLTPDGGYLIGGTSSSNDGPFTTNKGVTDIVLIKIDASGVIQWAGNYGGTDKDNLASLGLTSDNNYLLGATTFSNDVDVSFNNGSADYWILKVDTLGAIVWEKTFGGSNGDYCSGIQEIAGGLMFMAGSSSSIDGDVNNNHGKSDYWVAKLFSKDSIIWKNSFGGSEDEIAFAFQQNAALGYVVCGNSLSNDGDVSGHVGPFGANGTTDAWLMKLTDQGILDWQDSYGGGLNETATDVFQQTDNDYVICGWSNSLLPNTAPNHGGYDNYILKMAKNGNRKWSLSLGGSDDEISNSISQTPDSGYVLTGSTRSNDFDVTGNNGNEDIWVVRLGQQIPNSISEINLHSNSFVYPNPAIDIIKINIGETIFPIVDKIEVYDITGSIVEVLPTLGSSTVILNRKNKSSGIYSYRLYSGIRAMGFGKFIVK